MLQAIIIYIIMAIILSFTLAIAKVKLKDNRRYRVGSTLAISAFVFNIIYTAILGWHAVANSELEWTLDILDAIPLYIGFYMLNGWNYKTKTGRK